MPLATLEESSELHARLVRHLAARAEGGLPAHYEFCTGRVCIGMARCDERRQDHSPEFGRMVTTGCVLQGVARACH